MFFDLHTLVPAIGQVNPVRLNDRFGEIESEARGFGSCAIEDGKGLFEPSDSERGDVARIWLYMMCRLEVVIPDDELRMFMRWQENDPLSEWERECDRRIQTIQGNGNPFVQ